MGFADNRPGYGEISDLQKLVVELVKGVHLVLVRDFSTKKITWYHNGKAETPASTVYAEASISDLPLIIGNGYAGAFIGQMDDVAIWPRALTAQEITVLYTATAVGR